MKIILTENQLRLLTEQRVEYTPEKINEMVDKGITQIEYSKSLVEKYVSIVKNINVGSLLENDDVFKYIDEIRVIVGKIDAVSSKYYSVINMYDVEDDLSDNVNKLDDIATQLDNITDDFKKISGILSSLLQVKNKLETFQ